MAIYDRIRVYSIWHRPGAGVTINTPEHVDWQAEYVEVQGGRSTNWNFNQIWDLTYINTHWYKAGNDLPGWETDLGHPLVTAAGRADLPAEKYKGWETYHRKWNVRAGPNRDSDLLGKRTISVWRYWPSGTIPAVHAPLWENPTTLTNWDVDPRERFFFVTHDKGKTVWWKAFFATNALRDDATQAGGSATSCHPFCNNNCHFPFSKRWCRGYYCAQKDGGTIGGIKDQVAEFYIRPTEYNYNQAGYPIVGSDLPIECNPREYMRYPRANDMVDPEGDWDEIWRVDPPDNPNKHWPINFQSPSGNVAVKLPRTAVPYRNLPPKAEPVITTTTTGVSPPPFVPVAHNASVVNTTVTKEKRPEASEWWKWALLGLFFAILLGVLIGALFLVPKNIVRRPIVREVQEVEQRLVQKPKERVVEYKPTARKTIVEKQIIEKKTTAKIGNEGKRAGRRERSFVEEKRGFNPYKKKDVVRFRV